jgi:hypothetical protein
VLAAYGTAPAKTRRPATGTIIISLASPPVTAPPAARTASGAGR